MPFRTLCALAMGVVAAAGPADRASAQPFTYTFFPTTTTIDAAYTTDFQIVGFSAGQFNPDTFAPEFTGPSSPTITIAAGASLPDVEIFNSSVVNVTGGTSTVVPYDTSTVNIQGGVVRTALSFDSAVVNMHAGRCEDLEGQGARVNVYGGTVGIVVANSSISGLGDQLGSCAVDVFGGTFEAGSYLAAFNNGVLNLRGGLIQSDFIGAGEGGTLNIYGTNLAAQLVNPNSANGSSIYRLSGQLADGSSIDGVEMRIRNDGVTYGNSRFYLINVPAPGAVGVLGLGLMAASRRRRTAALRGGWRGAGWS